MGKYAILKENISSGKASLIASGLTKEKAERIWHELSWKHVDEYATNFKVIRDKTDG